MRLCLQERAIGMVLRATPKVAVYGFVATALLATTSFRADTRNVEEKLALRFRATDVGQQLVQASVDSQGDVTGVVYAANSPEVITYSRGLRSAVGAPRA